MMYTTGIFTALLVTILSLKSVVALSSKAAPHFTFGGVNYPHLALLEPSERDVVIQKLVDAGTKVIRLFITGDKTHEDFEIFNGVYDEAILNKFDDTLAAINKISKGETKVIITPHDIHSLRETNDAPCDAYCKTLKPSWMDFYVTDKMRDLYKLRLTYLFARYESPNFEGKTWSELSDVILGVDLQNEPWSGVWPIPAGEPWICDIATHLKDTLEFGKKNIAVITGGISGAFEPGEDHNWPWKIFKCDAIDVVGVNAVLSRGSNHSAGYEWNKLFNPGSYLMGESAGRKLVLVESFSYAGAEPHDTKLADIWDQANTLNFKGIPWLYSSVIAGEPSAPNEINILEDEATVSALKTLLQRATTSPSKLDWTKFVAKPEVIVSHSTITPNPYSNEQGRIGTLCSGMNGCKSDLVCKNNICQPCTLGCPGMVCNSAKPCQEHLQCLGGVCQDCTYGGDSEAETLSHDPAQVPLDSSFQTTQMCNFCDRNVRECRGAPCERGSDCSTDEICDWGLCKPCTEGCIGERCKSSLDCSTSHCSLFKRCDYPPPNKPKSAAPATGRRSPYGPGTEDDRKGGAQPGSGPQPVAPGNVAHSRGAGESAEKPQKTAQAML